MEKFRQKYSPDLCENELPAQSYFEEFEESLAEGRLEAERLRDVVSEEEAQEQRKLKADPARQYGMHLDGKLTLQTRKKFTSSEPSNRNNSERNSQSCRTCGFSRSSVSQEGPFTRISPVRRLRIT